jgi:hypothetical protein
MKQKEIKYVSSSELIDQVCAKCCDAILDKKIRLNFKALSCISVPETAIDRIKNEGLVKCSLTVFQEAFTVGFIATKTSIKTNHRLSYCFKNPLNGLSTWFV